MHLEGKRKLSWLKEKRRGTVIEKWKKGKGENGKGENSEVENGEGENCQEKLTRPQPARG